MKKKAILEITEKVQLTLVELQKIKGGGDEGETTDEPASNPPPGNP